jgi:hypothetical protein
MSTAKFEKLIDLIINEDHERAEQLFHDIVVEKSRTIYESLMDEDMTSGLTDEVSAEEDGMDGMMEDDDEFETDEVIDGDYDVDGDDFGDDEGIEGEIEMDADELGAEEGEAELEDRVVDLEDKLDELMAEFESMMAGEEGEESYDDEEFDDGEEEYDAGEEEEEAGEEEEDEAVMENIDLKQVPGLYGSKISQDSPDGSKKGPVDANSGQKGMASKPVNFVDGGTETMPSKPAKPTGYAAKGEKEQPLAGKYQNRPNANPTVAKTGKGESVGMQYGDTKSRAQGKEAGAGGSVKQDNKSVIESRRTTKRRV